MKTHLASILRSGLLASAALALCGAAMAQPSNISPRGATARRAYVPQEIMVKFRGGTSWALANGIHAKFGAMLLHNFPYIGWQRLRVPAGTSVEAALAQYKAQANVEAVEPNYVWKPLKVSNDPRLGQQYALNKIKAPTAWDSTTGDSGVVVAVIDTGVDYTHPDLSANMWRNPGEIAGNSKDDDNNGYIDDVYGIDAENGDTDPLDDDDHGTHCAGVIGAASNNGVGISGINWSVRIMALKFLGPDGGSTAGAIKCFEYVTMMKRRGTNIRVTSNSWGGAGYSAALKTAMDAAGNAGVIHMTASGNDGFNTDSEASYPSNFNSPSVVSVAASDAQDNRPSWSNYGRTSVDLAAPGNDILSTVRGGYAFYSGTSMATPQVSGAAALLAAYQPSLTVEQLKATLMNTVDVLPQWTGNVVSNGRLNLARAIASLTSTGSGPAPMPTTPPVTIPTPPPVVVLPTPPALPTPVQPTPRPRKITAKGDTYTFDYQQLKWTVAAPGVLANDKGGNGTLRASLIDDAYWGTVDLAADGSFTYTADPRYPPIAGDKDSFTYQVTDGVSFSKIMLVKLKFAALSRFSAKARGAASVVTLLNATAGSMSHSTILYFSRELDATKASNRANYSVTVNDEDVAVQSVIYNSSANNVLLQLAKRSVQAGDTVRIIWEDLKDAAGRDVTDGSVNVTAD
ncbi:MAG TPA: S8 family serine peptidase [Abditibacteriaceae bacterium]|jgi:hypothetical protein